MSNTLDKNIDWERIADMAIAGEEDFVAEGHHFILADNVIEVTTEGQLPNGINNTSGMHKVLADDDYQRIRVAGKEFYLFPL